MKVQKSWGASGEVVLSRSNDDPQDLKSQEPVFIAFDGLPVPFSMESVQAKGNRFIVKFQDIDSLAEAEELVGREVTLSQENPEEEDSLVGLRVRDRRSRRIVGTIVDFSDFGGNAVITVATETGGDVLLPLHEDLIAGIRGDVITLTIPEGLL